MTTAIDVAAYILTKHGPTTAMKLQKLVYYSQAWSLVWTGKPLFAEPLEAWDGGPISRSLFAKHRGMRTVPPTALVGAPLSPEQASTVDAVFAAYGHFDGDDLSERTHAERPWLFARDGVPAKKVIEHDAMRAYYRDASAGPFAIQPEYFAALDVLIRMTPEQLREVHEVAADVSANDYEAE